MDTDNRNNGYIHEVLNKVYREHTHMVQLSCIWIADCGERKKSWKEEISFRIFRNKDKLYSKI